MSWLTQLFRKPRSWTQDGRGTRVLVADLGPDSDVADGDHKIWASFYPQTERRTGLRVSELASLAASGSYEVIHLVARYDEAGLFHDGGGRTISLKDLIHKAHQGEVALFWLAQANEFPEHDELRGSFRMHFVLTLDRKGDHFTQFLGGLLERMTGGSSMPVAWNDLAPQYRQADHSRVPETICAMGRGQARFLA